MFKPEPAIPQAGAVLPCATAVDMNRSTNMNESVDLNRHNNADGDLAPALPSSGEPLVNVHQEAPVDFLPATTTYQQETLSSTATVVPNAPTNTEAYGTATTIQSNHAPVPVDILDPVGTHEVVDRMRANEEKY